MDQVQAPVSEQAGGEGKRRRAKWSGVVVWLVVNGGVQDAG
jgi:hypothetical protein